MTDELSRKVERAIRLLQSVPLPEEGIEVAYSGGKDSDVILELARMAGIKYRAIYKNTTIDPPGTIKHCRENGVEIMKPRQNFFSLMQKKGLPNRYRRFCCEYLKEYPVLRYAVIGVRRSESKARSDRYKEPVLCRVYNKSKNLRVQQILPILDWTDEDELDFIRERGIRLHPLYYREDGTIDITRRLGCMCCPLQAKRRRIQSFKDNPRMLKLYIKNGQIFRDTHPASSPCRNFGSIYEQMVREIFFESNQLWLNATQNQLFPMDEAYYKAFIEKEFNVDL